MVFKALGLGNCYFRRMWCLEGTDFGYFLYWEGVVVLILFILGGCSGLEMTDICQFCLSICGGLERAGL